MKIRSTMITMTAVLGILVLAPGAMASLVVIPVENHSFEDYALNDGAWEEVTPAKVPGWTPVNYIQSSIGIWNPQDGSFNGTTGSAIPAPGDGSNLINAQTPNLWKLYQQPDSHTILANQEYTLTTAVGERKDYGHVFSSMRISLKAGSHDGTALATRDLVKQDLDDESVIRGNLHDFAISFNSADYAGQVGQSLYIVYEAYESTGGQVAFDNVRLNVIPEPGTIALLGLAGLAMLIRRRFVK